MSKPSFCKSYLAWCKENYALASISTFGVPIFGGALAYLGILEVASSIVVGVVFVVIPALYYHRFVWKNHVIMREYFCVFREVHFTNCILVSAGDTTSFFVPISFGPAVANWSLRVRVAGELSLIDVHKETDWKRTISSRDGIACISSNESTNSFQLRIDIQKKRGKYAMPTSLIRIDLDTNIEHEKAPRNQDECKSAKYAQNEEFQIILIPEEHT